MWNDRYSAAGLSLAGRAAFDPATMTIATMGMQAVGTGLSAASTIAGGNTAATAGQLQQAADQYQADQATSQEGTVIGAAQRQMLDTQLKTKLMSSSLEANAAAGGVNAAVGSPLATEKSIASRGTYQALMDLAQGQNRAVGLENEAKGDVFSGDIAEWSGQQQKDASRINALATIAGGGASMAKSYAAFNYPTASGRAGIGYG